MTDLTSEGRLYRATLDMQTAVHTQMALSMIERSLGRSPSLVGESRLGRVIDSGKTQVRARFPGIYRILRFLLRPTIIRLRARQRGHHVQGMQSRDARTTSYVGKRIGPKGRD
jgi:hypothetical protein